MSRRSAGSAVSHAIDPANITRPKPAITTAAAISTASIACPARRSSERARRRAMSLAPRATRGALPADPGELGGGRDPRAGYWEHPRHDGDQADGNHRLQRGGEKCDDDAAPQPLLVGEEIRGDHHLAVAGSDRMHDAV